jgi:hypothetical protein
MRSQGVLLTVALQLVVQYYVYSFPAIEAYLKILGREHGCPRNWQLAEQWKQALERTSEKMLAGYAKSRHT